MNEFEFQTTKIKEEILDIDYDDNEIVSNSFNTENLYFKCGEIYATNTGTFSFFCIFCNENYTNFEFFSKHINSCHNITDTFSSNDQKEQSNYLNENLMKVETENNDKLIVTIADECNETIDVREKEEINEEDEKCEKEECNDVKEIKLDVIQKKAKKHISKKSLKYHNKRYNCEVCPGGVFYKNLRNLQQHMALKHISGKPYKCDQCDKTYSSKSGLDNHKRYHTGERPHKCEYCLKTFRLAYDLRVHIRIHTGEKPYQCEICDKFFRSHSLLNGHKQVHTGKKPYQCNQCDKTFTRNFGVKKHKKRYHSSEKH